MTADTIKKEPRVATRRNPEQLKARHVRVLSKNAAANLGGDNPKRRTGEPKKKITALLRSSDCHGGLLLISKSITSSPSPKSSGSTEPVSPLHLKPASLDKIPCKIHPEF